MKIESPDCIRSLAASGRGYIWIVRHHTATMPKFSKDKEQTLKELLRLQGCSDKMAAKILRAAQAETAQEGASATTEMQQQLLEELRQQKKQGTKFCRADILEFLGRDDDELPAEFEELLDDKDA